MDEDDEELVGTAAVATAVGVILVGKGGGSIFCLPLCCVGYVRAKRRRKVGGAREERKKWDIKQRMRPNIERRRRVCFINLCSDCICERVYVVCFSLKKR